MGNLLESLPGVIFFLYLLAKILHGLNKEIEEEPTTENREDEIEDFGKKRRDLDQEQKIPKPEEMKPNFEPKIDLETKEESCPKSNQQEEVKRTTKARVKRRKASLEDKLNAQRKKLKKTQILTEEISRDDILRGVIFKEILDRPRALRKYRPPYRSER
ncbi:hypothetical protein MWH28_11815 [Natroniella sulfidigena]|uniref:hypothetical protein n=1 Tax=Natroniella sulfidigena TaxID=723921 RepID=UPI00200B3FAF|nr:hypothetical protein [Natroniella sulfidigena]MCK8818044.1 hypothetical protein [Natroniella sulfidigena]